MVTPLISFENISKRFKDKWVLKNITFDVYEKDVFGLIGPSGSGKTTMLRVLIGFLKPDSGDVTFEGKDISKDVMKLRSIFGFASQEDAFYDKLTVNENMEHFGTLYGLKEDYLKKKIPELLKLVDLLPAKDTVSGSISGGMKRRLGVAISLLHDPRLLIFDEPTAGLDPILRKKMWQLIQRINKLGKTIIVSSHALGEIEHLCSRVGIIKEGTILTVNTPEKLRDLYSKNEEIRLECFPGNYAEIERRLLAAKLPISYINNSEQEFIIYTTQAEKIVHYLMHLLEEMKETLLTVDVNKPTLDEVFEALTRRPVPIDEKMRQCQEYVDTAKGQGIPMADIRKALGKQGWPKNIIAQLTK